MKALIVDDELHLIHTIKMLVPWQQLGIDKVFAATTVSEAKKLLKEEKPELAFFDIVIGNEYGTDLMNYVVEEQIPVKVLAISGYSNFEYVRNMLLLGCVDYLLKPLERAPLIDAVKKAIDSWEEDCKKNAEARALLHQINYLSSEHKYTLFSQLLIPSTSGSAYRELKSLSSDFAAAQTCLILYSDLTFYPMRNRNFKRDFTMFFDILRTDLENKKLGTAILRPLNQNDAVIILYGHTEQGLCSVQTAILQFRIQSQYPLHFGSCSCTNLPSDILEAYYTAKQGFYSAELYSEKKRPMIIKSGNKISSPASVNHTGQAQIFSALLLKIDDMIYDSTQKWVMNMLSDNNLTYGHIKRMNTEFETLYSDWCSHFRTYYPAFQYKKQLYLTPYLFFDDTYSFQISKVIQCYGKILTTVSEELGKATQSHDIIQKIGDYLEINYNQPFSQTEYARIFHLNKDYMCRRFKEFYGVSMVTRLNEIRIEQAKKLLRFGDDKIADIALQIGYNDEKYFIRTFKKHVGMTPTEYRQKDL